VGAAGRFLVECTGAARVLDVASGSLTALLYPGGRAGSWDAMGARYVEGFAYRLRCGQSIEEARRGTPSIALYDLAAGAVTHRPQSGAADLDRRGPRACVRVLHVLLAGEKVGANVGARHGVGAVF
jgi:hypothetical protein